MTAFFGVDSDVQHWPIFCGLLWDQRLYQWVIDAAERQAYEVSRCEVGFRRRAAALTHAMLCASSQERMAEEEEEEELRAMQEEEDRRLDAEANALEGGNLEPVAEASVEAGTAAAPVEASTAPEGAGEEAAEAAAGAEDVSVAATEPPAAVVAEAAENVAP